MYPVDHLNVGVALGNVPLNSEDQDVLYGSLGLSHGGELPMKGAFRHAFRAAASTQNITFSEESTTGYRLDLHGQVDSVFRITHHLPAIFRGGVAYTVKWEGLRLRDTLSAAAFTMHVQYDDDLTQRSRSAMRVGGELLLCDMLALRAGWYSERLITAATRTMQLNWSSSPMGLVWYCPVAR